MIRLFNIKFLLFFITLILLQSCKSVEVVKQKEFDYSQFEKITLLSNNIEIVNEYTPTYDKPFIDHTLEITPIDRLSEWINNNIKGLGVENKVIIIINDSSISVSQIDNNEKVMGIVKKQNEIKYQLKYNVMYILYDDSDTIIGKTNVKIERSTTSGTQISLKEKDIILNNLIYYSLEDFVMKSEESINKYLGEYTL